MRKLHALLLASFLSAPSLATATGIICPKLGFTVQSPSDWNVIIVQDPGFAFQIINQDRTKWLVAEVFDHQDIKEMSLEECAKSYADSSTGKRVTISGPAKYTEIEGREFAVLTLKAEDHSDMQSYAYLTKANGKVYNLTATSRQEGTLMPMEDEKFGSILRSFKMLPGE